MLLQDIQCSDMQLPRNIGITETIGNGTGNESKSPCSCQNGDYPFETNYCFLVKTDNGRGEWGQLNHFSHFGLLFTNRLLNLNEILRN